MSEKVTDAQLVLEYIEEFGSITPLDALRDLGVYRLSGRIADLRKMGYPIVTKLEPVKTMRKKNCRIARYSMGGDTND